MTKQELDTIKTEKNLPTYTDKQIQLIHDLYAKNTTKEEFELFLYTAGKYGLDPLVKQIWCVKFKDSPAQIYAGRDGFNEIAHRSGAYNGLESGMKDDNIAFCKVYRKDMDNPFYVEVSMNEYSTNMALWKTKPRTMLTKVAESQALRKAFSISGIYAPEEMGQWELEAQGIKFEPEQPKPIEQKQYFDWSKLDLNKIPKWEFSKDKKPLAPKIVKRLFAISKNYNIPADEFKSLCEKLTDKQHSYQWTYGDIKLIEESMNRIHDEGIAEVEEILEPELEDELDKI